MGQEASNLHPDTPQFILFGDSLTQWAFVEEQRGFGWFLEQQYGRKVFIRNEGKAGYTSTDLLEDFTRILKYATASGARRTLLFTIFLGANDACVLDPHGHEGCVPLSEFEANIRMFVETLLVQDAMPETKIVLITPPPINVSSPLVDEDAKVGIEELNMEERKGRPYKTYLSKKRYAERVMEIAREYEETGRVVGVDFWGALVRAGCSEKGVEFCEDRLIGSGLYGVEEFGEGWFTDGLHLDRKGYEVLSESLWAKMMLMWPELRPEALEMPPEVEAVG